MLKDLIPLERIDPEWFSDFAGTGCSDAFADCRRTSKGLEGSRRDCPDDVIYTGILRSHCSPSHRNGPGMGQEEQKCDWRCRTRWRLHVGLFREGPGAAQRSLLGFLLGLRRWTHNVGMDYTLRMDVSQPLFYAACRRPPALPNVCAMAEGDENEEADLDNFLA